jgi:hypothetical protein
MNTRSLGVLKTDKMVSSTVNDYWDTEYQRRSQRQAVRLEKTEPVIGSAKNPPLKPASCAALQLSDCKKVFFIS